MILTCPACATQYRLKDGAIPPEGRQVRCAACKHKWHQDGEPAASEADADMAAGDEAIGQWPVAGGHDRAASGLDAIAAGGEEAIAGGPPQPDPRDSEEPLANVPDDAGSGHMVAEPPEPEVAGGSSQWPAMTDQSSADQAYAPDDQGFAAIPAMNDDEEPPRGGKLGWIAGLILIVVAAAALFYFFAPPEMKARAGIAEAGESPLQLMLTTSDRQRLASGNELLAISGRVINSTDREQVVPPIHAELRDPASNRLVYQWTIAPPARSLAPGAAASFNSAEVDVPEGGENLSLRFAS